MQRQDSGRDIALRIHGGAEAKRIGRSVPSDPVIDFSVNTNTYGPSPRVVASARSALIDRYPDSTATLVREAAADRHGVSPNEAVFGNGAADLIWTAGRTVLQRGTHVLIVEPCFAEFRAVATVVGADIAVWTASARDDFRIDLDAIEQTIRRQSIEVLYVSSPNTPTGSSVNLQRLSEMAQRRSDLLILFDQSFAELSDDWREARQRLPDNVVQIVSMTKAHAIPGLRAGYLLSSAPLARRIEANRPAWTTSSPAQSAALAALADDDFLADCREQMFHDRAALLADLRGTQWRALPTSTIFCLLRCQCAAALTKFLLQQGLFVRDCTSFGLPDHVRICARPAADRQSLFAALRKAESLRQ